MNKIVLVINGAGGVGKDTLCELSAKHFRVKNISSVDPIKEIAKFTGWTGVKDDRARKFLADLKQLTAEYNDFPTNWAMAEYRKFLETDEEILFVHIREPHEIVKFVNATGGAAKTLLVRGGSRKRQDAYGNSADDCVENYSYDYYFENDRPLEDAEIAFSEMLGEILSISGGQTGGK